MAAATAALGLGAGAEPAIADQPVVTARVFSGTEGVAPQTRTVTDSSLADCPYEGPASIPLYPGGIEITIPTPTSWTLAAVLQCGLSIPQSDVNSVKVLNGQTNAYLSPLLPAEIYDTETYPNGGGALPLVSANGDSGQIQYVRPWLGGSDRNGADNFNNQGPVSIDVYEHAAPLTVTIQPPAAAGQTSESEQATLSATVTTATGGAVSPADLTYSWTASGITYTGATPTVPIPKGTTIVGLEVDDAATGTAGTDTLSVTYTPPASPPPKQQKTPHPGAGNHPKGGPTGTPEGGKKDRGARPTKPHRQPSTTAKSHRSHRHTGKRTSQNSSATPPASTPPATTPPATTPPAQTTPPSTPVTPPPAAPTNTPGFTPVHGGTKPPPRKHHHSTAKHSRPGRSQSRHRVSGGDTSGAAPQVVTGRLVADLNTAPASSSPLIHTVAAQDGAAPLVHAAATSTSLPAWLYGTLAVVVLLAGGVAYERHGRRGRSLHR